ncbi:MAG: T9SS type A sorting domain-containing protein [Bacteroidota bacterium]
MWGLFAGVNLLQAQPNFAGGKGDGYATARLGIGTSIEQTGWEAHIRVWPNPTKASQILFVAFPPELAGEMVELIAADGRRLQWNQLPAQRTHFEWQLPALPAGLYLIRFRHASGTVSQKLQLLAP